MNTYKRHRFPPASGMEQYENELRVLTRRSNKRILSAVEHSALAISKGLLHQFQLSDFLGFCVYYGQQ